MRTLRWLVRSWAALVAFPLVGLPAPVYAAVDVSYRLWTVEEGLPQNSVRAIAQTPDGYLWIATFDGLVRFDGVRMHVYLKSNVPQMRSNRCLLLLVGRDGSLWVGTEDGGVLRVRGSSLESYGRAEGLPSDHVDALGEDGEGRAWARTAAGPAVFDGGRWRAAASGEVEAHQPFARRSTPPVQAAQHPGEPFAWWADNRAGATWALRGATLSRHENGIWQTFSTPIPSMLHPVPSAFFADREGSLWMGGNGGLVQATVTPVRALIPDGPDPVRNVYGLAEDGSGRVWVTTYSHPLLWERGAFTTLTGLPWWPPGWMIAIEPDTDGTVLAGGSTGLYRVRPHVGFEKLADVPFPYDILRDRTGRLWVASSKGLWRGQSGLWERVDGLPSEEVKALAEARDGALWVGTYGGLARLSGTELRVWTTADGLSSDRLRALHEEADGTLWIGTYDGGLNRLKNGRLSAVRLSDGLYDDGVFVILDDGAGRYWMTSNRGVHAVYKQDLDDFADGRTRRVTYRAWRATDGMPSSECNGGRQPAGFRAADGSLWVPTQRGIAIFDPGGIPENLQPPSVVIEAIRTERRTLPVEAMVTLEPGERTLAVTYTANTFIRPEGVRFRYRLEGLQPEWIEAGNVRQAQYGHLRPGRYILRVAAANSDGTWNEQGATLAIDVRPYWWQTGAFRLGVVVFGLFVLALAYRSRVALLKRRQAEQEAFSRQLLASQEAERKRIASDVHDGIGQTLAVIRTRALLGLRSGMGVDAMQHIEEISSAAQEGIDEVRKIAHGLRPFRLESLGLTRALEALISETAASSGIPIDAAVSPLDSLFERHDEIHVYRIVQEALSNMVRHAKASRAYVTIDVQGRDVLIQIEDDGTGFDPSGSRSGLGLAGIAERARILGGRSTIRSTPGRGTQLVVHLAGAAGRHE